MPPLARGLVVCGVTAALLFPVSFAALAQANSKGYRYEPMTTFQFGLRSTVPGNPSPYFRSTTGTASSSTVQDYPAQSGPAQLGQPNVLKNVPRNTLMDPQATIKTDSPAPGGVRTK
jgi:hypothetical protein